MEHDDHIIDEPATTLQRVRSLHAGVEAEVRAHLAVYGDQLACKVGCCRCCVDDLTVFAVEADLIRRHHATLLKTESAHEPGACAFLDEQGACRIYENRPYVCRTQGLPLRWLGEDDGGRTVEYRDICPLNDNQLELEHLPVDQCWTLGPWEGRLASLQAEATGGALCRVSLRELFGGG